jgi:ATP-dependent Clp protease ATP-binding subunit ClpA
MAMGRLRCTSVNIWQLQALPLQQLRVSLSVPRRAAHPYSVMQGGLLRTVRTPPIPIRPRRDSPDPRRQSGSSDLLDQLSARVIGQPQAMTEIVPYVRMHRAGLAPEGRPVGVFLLLGPTGTGKTKTVEALAEVLHGSERNMVKVDCGEFQMEHEVAKLIGAPPGYLGHRETQPIITQQKLNSITSESSNLSLVLFDEIEKAAPSMTRLLLGVLDKATLRLGDNTSVNFERSMIFLTSNLGAEAMRKLVNPDFGFEAMSPISSEAGLRKLQNIGWGAVKRKFAPEFVNRIDAVITYQPLNIDSLEQILDQQILALEKHILTRLDEDAFGVEVTPEARQFLLKKGTSTEFGARELKRVILRLVTQPLAAMVESGDVPPDSVVYIDCNAAADALDLTVEED